jgi:hypothetical protein
MKKLGLGCVIFCLTILTNCTPNSHGGLAPYILEHNTTDNFSLEKLGSLVKDWATVPQERKKLEEECYRIHQSSLSVFSLPPIIQDAGVYNSYIKTREFHQKKLELCNENPELKKREAEERVLNYIPEYNIWFVVEVMDSKWAVAKVAGHECVTKKSGPRRSMAHMLADILVTHVYSENTRSNLPDFSKIIEESGEECEDDK